MTFRPALVAIIALAAMPAAAAVPSDGLYLMTKMYGSSLSMEAFAFRGGKVVRNPAGDVARLDPGKVKPDSHGSYAASGKDLVVTWGDGKKTQSEMQQGDRCFNWDGGLFCPVKPFDNGARLDGVFSGGASAGGGALSSSTTFKFQPDGRYERSTFGTVTPGANVAGAVGGGTKESGAYTLDGTALSLKPEGGPARTLLAFPYDDGSKGPQPGRVYVDGTMLKRQ